ncbi:unnamed protein product, partial [Rotaria sordida]
MPSRSAIHITTRSPKNNIHPTKNQSANPQDILFPMSTILAARYYQVTTITTTTATTVTTTTITTTTT